MVLPNLTGVTAEVYEGRVKATDKNGRFLPAVKPTAVFTDYVVRNRYEKDGRVYMGGVTSPGGFQGDSAAFVQLAAPTLLLLCEWTAERTAVQPPIPAPNSLADPDWILLDEHYETAEVLLGADGVTPVYRISGTYTYGHKNPSGNTLRNLAFGRPAWLDDTGVDRSVPDSSLTGNIIDQKGKTLGGITPVVKPVKPPTGNVTLK